MALKKQVWAVDVNWVLTNQTNERQKLTVLCRTEAEARAKVERDCGAALARQGVVKDAPRRAAFFFVSVRPREAS